MADSRLRADVESDMSRFHRVDDFTQLPVGKFVRLFDRLGHYDGAVAQRIRQAHQTMLVEAKAKAAFALQQRTSPSGKKRSN